MGNFFGLDLLLYFLCTHPKHAKIKLKKLKQAVKKKKKRLEDGEEDHEVLSSFRVVGGFARRKVRVGFLVCLTFSTFFFLSLK